MFEKQKPLVFERRKTLRDSGRLSKITSSCKWQIRQDVALGSKPSPLTLFGPIGLETRLHQTLALVSHHRTDSGTWLT